MIASISIPATAIGNKPTGVITEKRPPISSGMTNVSYPSLSAIAFKVPLALSVVATIRLQASSFPYFSSINCFKKRNAKEVSVVVPDLEITLTHTSLSLI